MPRRNLLRRGRSRTLDAKNAECCTEDRETSPEVKGNLTQAGKVDEDPVGDAE